MKYEIAQMVKTGGGPIVNVVSILGAIGFANAPAYTAAKHGVLGLTRTAAVEYGMLQPHFASRRAGKTAADRGSFALS